MNSFTKKGIVRKIILILVCLILFNCIYPSIFSVTFAEPEESKEQSEAEKTTSDNTEKLRTEF